MSHTPIEVLKENLTRAHEDIEVGAHYAHYKHPGIPYLVTELSILEATEEVVVTYKQETPDGISFVRPLISFIELVETDTIAVPRFRKIT